MRSLACPLCKGQLALTGDETATIYTGALTCSRCRQTYAIAAGIARFIQPECLTGATRRWSRIYDKLSWGYWLFSKLAFAFIGMKEEVGRREITDRLDPRGGRVLEVSIGPGINLPYLMHRPDVGEVFGLDIAAGQLQRCRRYADRNGWDVDLILGDAEQLPFKDDTFDAVFHVGGINFFENKKAAIEEMARVAKPGASVLIADENEKGARAYETFIPGFRKIFDGKREAILPPVHLVPSDMLGTRATDVCKGWLYCIEFRKPRR